MDAILLVVHIVVAAALVGMVLLQQGKGADMGAAFGAGASGTVFGAQGSANFLSRVTAVLATVFFLTSLALAYFAVDTAEPESVIQTPSVQMPASDSDVPVMDVETPSAPPVDAGKGDLPPQ